MKKAIALILVLSMVLLTACGVEKRWQKYYDIGCEYLEDEDYEEAIEAFTRAIEADSRRPDAFMRRGDAYLQAVRECLEDDAYEDAEEYLEEAEEDFDRAEDLDYDDEDELDDRREEMEVLTEQIHMEDVGPDGVRPQDGDREEVLTTYRDFFYSLYSDDDYVVLADITGDGVDEMMVVHYEDPDGFEIGGYVYTLERGEVIQIFSNRGSSTHAGGFYGWYLVERDGGYCLGQESFGMWQGMGVLSFTQYTVDANGEMQILDELVLDTGEEGNHDADGFVTEEAMEDYQQALCRVLERSYCICATFSEGSGSMWIETFPPVVFGIMDDAPPATEVELAGVEDAYMEVLQSPFGEYEYCCHIPRFVLSDDRCEIMNELIYQDLSQIMNENGYYLEGYESQPAVGICYSMGQAEGIASVVALVALQNSDYWVYRTYNMNIATGWEANDQEVIAAFGYTEEQYRERVYQILERQFQEMFVDIPDFVSQEEYEAQLEMTLSDENIALARPFVDEAGQLCAVANIYGFAGASYYQYRICLENSTGIAEPDYQYCQQHG